MNMKNTLLCLIVIISLLSGCTSYRELVNYQEPPRLPVGPQAIDNYEPLTIQPDDLLGIAVSLPDPDALRPFASGGGEQASGLTNFLVDSEGNIEFPTIGKVNVAGLKIEEAKVRLVEQLAPFFNQNPIVRMRLLNFRVNVNGEVQSPGNYIIGHERLTIIEAITQAGDFSRYAQRDSVMVIREMNGIRNIGYVDFTSAEVFESPYFFLRQNDVIYVKPNKNIVTSVSDPATKILPWISGGVSIALLIFTISRNN